MSKATTPSGSTSPNDALVENPWDEHADLYQRFVREREQTDLSVDPFVSTMLTLLGDVQGKGVLDACCGEGYFSRVLAARGARVIAIDLSPRLIELARERQRTEGPEQRAIQYRVGDLTRSIPELSGRFSLVASHLALNDVRDHRAFLRVLAELSASGARLVVALNNPYSALVRGHLTDYFDVDARPRYIGMAQRGIHVRYYHRTLGEYLDAFIAAGWRLAKLVDVWPGANDLLPAGTRFPYGLVLAFDNEQR